MANVRKATVQYITSQLEGRPPLEPSAELKASTMSLPNFSREETESTLGESVMSEILPPPVEVVPMDPLYVHSQRELDEAFREMLPHFEGKETEHNWIVRDKSVTKIRRLTSGNAPTEFHVAFVMGIKTLADGINRTANSLRTTMSTNGCQLVQELAKTLGSSFDPIADYFLSSFVKMSGATKHIASANGSTTVHMILGNISYPSTDGASLVCFPREKPADQVLCPSLAEDIAQKEWPKVT
jgi:CLIP-associating protein 1/2